MRLRQRLLQFSALAVVVIAIFGWSGCMRQALAPPAGVTPSPALPVPQAPASTDDGLVTVVLPAPPPPPPRWAPPAFPETAKPLAAPSGVKVVLLLGADDRPGAPGRSDSMLLAAVDTNNNTVRLVSLPRDAWAYIPGQGWDKWNSAYAYGHEALAKKTVERMLGIRVDYTAVLGFQGFAHIVDALDGVDVVVDHDLNYDDPWDKPPLHIHIKAGPQHLGGEQAVQFARFRADSQNDWGRIKRQQQLARAMLKQALRPQTLTRLPALITALASAYRTDIPMTERLKFALLLNRLKSEAIPSDTIPGTDRMVPMVLSDGTRADVWYTFLDLEAARQKAAWLVLGQPQGPAAFRDEAHRLSSVYRQAEPPRP